MTLRLLVDAQTFSQLPEMSFKAPGTLDDPALPGMVRANAQRYLGFRETELGTRYVPGSGKLTKLPLTMYAAKRFSLRRGSKAWFLVGDAAMGVPYFRALNCGMLLGSRLAMLMGRNGGLEPDRLNKLVNRFERRRVLHIATEFGIARTKDVLLNVFKALRRSLAASPAA